MTAPTTPPKKRSLSRRRKLLFAVIAMLSGLVFATVTVEASLRVFDPLGLDHEPTLMRYRKEALIFSWQETPIDQIDLDGSLYRHKPSLDLDLGSFRLTTNSLGFRGPEIAPQKPEGTFRVLVLGDSVAFGWGVNDEVTFLRRFEGELREGTGKPIEVVNTGHPKYDSTQQHALLRDEGLQLQPDLVMLVYVTMTSNRPATS